MTGGLCSKDLVVVFWAVWKPFLHSGLGKGEQVTWQMQTPLTETERLVMSMKSSASLFTGLEGSACEPGVGLGEPPRELGAGRESSGGGCGGRRDNVQFLNGPLLGSTFATPNR